MVGHVLSRLLTECLTNSEVHLDLELLKKPEEGDVHKDESSAISESSDRHPRCRSSASNGTMTITIEGHAKWSIEEYSAKEIAQ